MSSDAAGSARWLRWAFRYQSKRSLMASMVWVSWRPRLNSPRAGGYLVISSQWKITRAITWTTLCEQVDNEPSPDRNSPRSPELIGARSIAPGFRGFLQQIVSVVDLLVTTTSRTHPALDGRMRLSRRLDSAQLGRSPHRVRASGRHRRAPGRRALPRVRHLEIEAKQASTEQENTPTLNPQRCQ